VSTILFFNKYPLLRTPKKECWGYCLPHAAIPFLFYLLLYLFSHVSERDIILILLNGLLYCCSSLIFRRHSSWTIYSMLTIPTAFFYKHLLILHQKPFTFQSVAVDIDNSFWVLEIVGVHRSISCKTWHLFLDHLSRFGELMRQHC